MVTRQPISRQSTFGRYLADMSPGKRSSFMARTVCMGVTEFNVRSWTAKPDDYLAECLAGWLQRHIAEQMKQPVTAVFPGSDRPRQRRPIPTEEWQ